LNRQLPFFLLGLALVAHLLVVLSSARQTPPVIQNLHNDTIHRVGRAADFYAVYHAALNLREGRDPYANDDDGVTPYYYVFRYLPAVAYAGLPLTVLSPGAAYLLWVVILELLLAAVLVLLWRTLPPDNVRLAAMLLLLLSTPYFLEIYMGQFTFAAVALLVLALLVPRAGGLYVVSVLLKPMGLAVWPVLLRRRSRWWLVVVSAAAVLLTSAPHFLGHQDQWRTFFDANFLMEGGFHPGNYGLVHLLRLLMEDAGWETGLRFWIPLMKVWRAALLGGAAMLVLLARRQDWRLSVPALLLAHFLSFQHVWEHHLSAVILLGVVALTAPELSDRSRWWLVGCLVVLAVPSPFGLLDAAKDPAVWNPAEFWPRGYSYLNVLPKVVASMGLFGLLIMELMSAGWQIPGTRWSSTRNLPEGD
jgi:hypothetical protein